MIDAYADFLARKRMVDPRTGLVDVPALPDRLFAFQRDITAWALRRGRAALFAGTGLGKSFMELAWAEAIHRETQQDILHLAPLAVSPQMAREAAKFGIAARIVRDQSECGPGVNITNYQKIEHFDLARFGGVILDESSILKSTDGHYRTRLIEECHRIPFRLAATATPAPNDFMELGNHAEFLGVMSYTDMLATFFTHDGGDTQKWRLKGHAENDFWRWMASWCVMLRHPRDLGYADAGYDLPPLNQHQHTVGVEYAPSLQTGLLFPMEATTLQERLAARRDTVAERVQMAASIVIGDYWSRISECHGSPNTKLTDAQKLSAIQSMRPGSGPLAAEPLRRTGNTCAHTIRRTRENGSAEHQSSKPNTTVDGEKNTHPILDSESIKKQSSETDAGSANAIPGLKGNTASPSINTTNSFDSRDTSARFAGEDPARSMETDLPSTTATILGASEGCSAPTAIVGSDCSETVETCSIGPSNISTMRLDPWVIWCHLNSEQQALEKAFGDLAISIHGGHTDEQKQGRHEAWLRGDAPVLIVKPSMFGHGLNWQHCSNMVFVGLNDSFEQVYQAIRRCWRFGQTKPVNVHFIAAETEGAVVANIRRKEADAERMAAALVRHMADLSAAEVRGAERTIPDYNPQQPVKLPEWIGAAA